MACEHWQTLSPRTGLFLSVLLLEPPDVSHMERKKGVVMSVLSGIEKRL